MQKTLLDKLIFLDAKDPISLKVEYAMIEEIMADEDAFNSAPAELFMHYKAVSLFFHDKFNFLKNKCVVLDIVDDKVNLIFCKVNARDFVVALKDVKDIYGIKVSKRDNKIKISYLES